MREGRGGKDEECRGDLLARERRGELAVPDRLALEAHLAQCVSCRLGRAVFIDLDDVSGIDLFDGARIERMSTMARGWAAEKGRRRVRLWPRVWAARAPMRTLALAALVLLLGGTASGAVWWFRQPHPAPAATTGVVEPVEHPPAVARRRAGPSRGPAMPAAQAPLDVAAEPVAAPPERGRAGRGEAVVGTAALLRQAGEARRSGDAERAIGLYRRLQRNFPRSPEATLSAVSLGGLLLERRLPRAALTQFDAYLAASRGGVLIPEALYGRGRALAALGDRSEERRSWERLLADFPDSAYAPFARRRMQELR